MTNLFSSTSIDSRYWAYCYDTLINIPENHEYKRLILSRRLIVTDDKIGALGLRGKGDLVLLE